MATDYWKLAETGLITLLRTELTAYYSEPAKQVTASDDSHLDDGFDFFAITYPGSFPILDTASSRLVYSWEILLDVITRWKTTESKAWNENGFKAYRADVIYLINHTNKGRNLGKTNFVRDAVISAEDRPNYIPVRGSDEFNVIYSHIRQVCVVTVQANVPRES